MTEEERTDWDIGLLHEARMSNVWEYQHVFDLIDLADSDATRYILNGIAEVLYKIHTRQDD